MTLPNATSLRQRASPTKGDVLIVAMPARASNANDRIIRRHAKTLVFVAVPRSATCAGLNHPCDTRAMQRDIIAIASATGNAAEKPVADRPAARGRSISWIGAPALRAAIGFDPMCPSAGFCARSRAPALNRDVVTKITGAVEARYDIARPTGAGRVFFGDREGLGLCHDRKKKGNEPTHGLTLARIHRQVWDWQLWHRQGWIRWFDSELLPRLRFSLL